MSTPRPHRAAAHEAPPALPRGLWKVTLGLFLLLLGDLPLIASLAVFLVTVSARSEPSVAALLGPAWASNGGVVACLYGGLLAFAYVAFPLMPLAGRAPLAISAARGLGLLLAALHPLLLAATATAFAFHPDEAYGCLVLAVPIAVLATPLAPFVAIGVLRMSFFGGAADPAPKAVAPGQSFGGRSRARLAAWVAIALLACLGMVLLPVAPLRGILPMLLAGSFTAALLRGRHGASQAAPPTPPYNAAPGRLWLGCLALPFVMLCAIAAAIALLALRGSGTIADFLASLSSFAFVLFVPAAIVLLTTTVVVTGWLSNTSRLRRGLLTYRLAGGAASLAYAALFLFFAALGFHLSAGSLTVQVAVPAYAIVTPMALVMLLPLPALVVLVASLGVKTDA